MEVVEMHEDSLTVLSSNKCREYNKDLQEESTICAGSVDKDTCYGNSGGGLYCRLPNSKIWYIAGVTSFGETDGCGKLPGLYTSVIAHTGWVQRVIREST
ncbi:unnamed protein product [Dicrocoelium dendriticum]|nr:unnamed protein product [Dicrocoelium dendriticum]